eukprot:scaffold18902_cov67-Skeletonema_dohrnii-CCMP3373.AAC.2
MKEEIFGCPSLFSSSLLKMGRQKGKIPQPTTKTLSRAEKGVKKARGDTHHPRRLQDCGAVH